MTAPARHSHGPSPVEEPQRQEACHGGRLVVIGGREFELGAVYASRDRGGARLRRLVAYAPAEGWRGGRVETLIIGRTARCPPFCDVVSGAWWARWAGERVAGPPAEAVDDDELEAQTRAATDAVRATVMRLLRENGIRSPARGPGGRAGGGGARGGRRPRRGGAARGILGGLGDLVRHAGQAQHEKLEAETMPTAGSA